MADGLLLTYLIANAAAVASFVAVGMLIFRRRRWRGFFFGLVLGISIGPMIVDAALVDSDDAAQKTPLNIKFR